MPLCHGQLPLRDGRLPLSFDSSLLYNGRLPPCTDSDVCNSSGRDHFLRTDYRQPGYKTRQAHKMLHVKRENVRRSAHLAYRDEPRVVDLFADHARSLGQRFPRHIDVWRFRYNWKQQLELFRLGAGVYGRQSQAVRGDRTGGAVAELMRFCGDVCRTSPREINDSTASTAA